MVINQPNMSWIHPDAKIDPTVTIGPFTTIHENVEIGPGTEIGSNVTIYPGARIGAGCRIFPGATVAAVPQDLKFVGEETTAIIGDGTVLRECSTVHRGTASHGSTEVGKNCLIMCYSHVAHDCVIGNNVIMSNACQLAGEVHVDDYAIIGGGTLIHQFCHIGAHVMIQGGALINKDIPPYVKAAREPISYVGVNTVGLHRRGFSPQTIEAIQNVYRTLYLSRLNVSQALQQIVREVPASAERDQIVAFIENSKRGIIRGYV